MTELFPAYEVGSLPKLPGRVKALSPRDDMQITRRDIDDTMRWGREVGVPFQEAVRLLRKKEHGGTLDPEERVALIDFNALVNLKLQEQSGLDVVYDGEARRIEMYQHAARQISGFAMMPEPLRSRGPDSWNAAVCIAEPNLKQGIEELPIIGEFSFAKQHARAALKVPLDDPYMIANMTDNEFYKRSLGSMERYRDDPKRVRYEAKRSLTLALAANVIRPQVEVVVDAGARWVQLDIPSAMIDVLHIPIMVEGINEVVRGIEDVKFSLHICYPPRKTLAEKTGYGLLFPHLLDLDPSVNHLSLELANGDQYEKDLEPFRRYQGQRKFEIGVGVVDITLERQQQGRIETPELVRDRILTATKVLKDPSLVYVAPDCGLRQVSLERAVQLYKIMVQGAALARKAV